MGSNRTHPAPDWLPLNVRRAVCLKLIARNRGRDSKWSQMCPVGSVLGCDNLEAEGTGTFRIHSKTSQAPAQHAAEPQGRGYQPPLGQLGSMTPFCQSHRIVCLEACQTVWKREVVLLSYKP